MQRELLRCTASRPAYSEIQLTEFWRTCCAFLRDCKTGQMDQQDDVSDVESEAYLGDDDGQLDQQDQEVADLNGPEAGACCTHISMCN